MNNISSTSNTLYKQIIDWVINCIESGQFKPGDKLPTEKEMSEQFQVSRGTVRTAMSMLNNNRMVDAVQGSGYYISSLQNAVDETNKDYSASDFNSFIYDLKSRNYSDEQIMQGVAMALNEYSSSQKDLRIIIVECNPDILPAFYRQLSSVPHLIIDSFIIHGARTFSEFDSLFSADIITTTPNHFKELAKLRPELLDKVVKYNVSITPKTLSLLSKIPVDAPVGLICKSSRYYELVKEALDNIFKGGKELSVCYAAMDPRAFLSGIDYLVVPYGYHILDDENFKDTLSDFLTHGGQIIEFDYQVDKGSFDYLKEIVHHIRFRTEQHS